MIDTYIQYGIDSDLATKLGGLGIPKTTFEKTSNKNLREKYGLPDNEIEIVKQAITRQPIDKETIEILLSNSNYTCCICKGTKSKSYIIHHIDEYSISQNNKYYNLAVLCPDDHDLAHKKGKSLTLKLTEEQIYTAKDKWENQVKDINIQKASKSGNIFEVDFLNIPRIIELYIEIFKTSPTSKYTEVLISHELLTDNGLINELKIQEVNNNPSTPLIFFAPYGSTTLKSHFYEVFKKILNQIEFKDLDSLLNKNSLKNGIVGEYCFYVGGLYSSKLPTQINDDSDFMKFHLSKKKFIVEWLVDPKYFCSSSAKWRTFQRNIYMIYGKIRNVNIEEIDGIKKIIIDIRPYCFGLPELEKNRKPMIAYRNQIDEVFEDDEE
jgi:hypothetical protein